MFRRLSGAIKFLSDKVSGCEDCNILIVGLDNSGKSTIIEFLKEPESEITEVVPTVGFRIENFKRHRLNFTVYDMSGQGKYRNLWEKQYSQTHAIIFVLDSCDDFRFKVAKDELDSLLEHKDIINNKDLPVLVLANKMDLKNASSSAECCRQLALEQIKNRSWCILASNAKTGDGVEQGLEWLAEHIDTRKSKRNKK